MKNLTHYKLIKFGIMMLMVAVVLILSRMTVTYAKDTDIDSHDTDIKAAITLHDTDVKADIATHDTDVKTDLAQHDTNVSTTISLHNSDIKADIVQYGTDIMGILNNTIIPNILIHDENMTTEHGALDTKLDEILAAVQNYAGANAAVPKTGQTTSHETGDDGDLERGVAWPNPRFTDNGDETITDNLTGLIWTKDANLFGSLTWSSALTSCNNLIGDGSISGGPTDDSVVGDWHLANRFELESLLHMAFYTPPVPNTIGTEGGSQGDPFNNIQPNFYWTSTTRAFNSTNAWSVKFGEGEVFISTKGSGFYVWCVRGGQ